jgi:hypothetical protein
MMLELHSTDKKNCSEKTKQNTVSIVNKQNIEASQVLISTAQQMCDEDRGVATRWVSFKEMSQEGRLRCFCSCEEEDSRGYILHFYDSSPRTRINFEVSLV